MRASIAYSLILFVTPGIQIEDDLSFPSFFGDEHCELDGLKCIETVLPPAGSFWFVNDSVLMEHAVALENTFNNGN
jgi:hypothetical protein